MNEIEKNHILHIGYPKTATKWFQNVFFPNVENCYFIDHDIVKEKIISPNLFRYKPDSSLLKEIENKRIIISEENLVGSIQDGGMQRLHTKEMALRLHELFPKGQVVIFIRNQVSIIASGYLQYIKMGGNYSVKKFLFDKDYSFVAKRKLFSFDFFKFDEVIEFYHNVFGKERVSVYLYEDFSKNPELFVSKFANIHNLEYSGELSYSPVNERYGKAMICFSRVANSFTKRPLIYKYYFFHVPKWYYISRELKRHLSLKNCIGRKPSDEDILEEKTVEYILNYYAKSNSKLAQLIGMEEELKEFGYIL